MEAHICNHPLVPHTVEYVLSSTVGVGASVVRPFGHLEDADIFAQKIIRQNTARLSWLKIYRNDNETYVCFRWENPKKEISMEENNVKLEVDMNPLKEAFDNVALGFSTQGRSIARLWALQGITAGLVLGDFIYRVLH